MTNINDVEIEIFAQEDFSEVLKMTSELGNKGIKTSFYNNPSNDDIVIAYSPTHIPTQDEIEAQYVKFGFED